MAGPASNIPSSRFFELDGLRAVAAFLVIFFHLWGVGRVSGGVDVFIFLGGFFFSLIVIRDPTVGSFRRFLDYLTRLLPLAVLVLSVVVLLALLDFALKPERTLLSEVIFSALMLENWFLALQSRDYLASDGWLSMVQHFWAVSIQVQLFAGFLVLSSLLKRIGVVFHSRASALFFIAVSLMSATYAFYTTRTNPTYAYFDTFARAWQFGAGVLIGFLATQIPGWLRQFHFPFASIGLGLILLTGIYAPPSLFPFPSGMAPVAGAALFVLGVVKAEDSPVKRLFRSPPFVFVGSLSYGLYLWHWPIKLMLDEVFWSLNLGLVWRFPTVASISTVVSLLTVRLLESPILTQVRKLQIGRKAVSTVMALTAVVVGSLAADRLTDRRDSARYAEMLHPYTSFAELRGDNADSYQDGCHLADGESEIRECVYGDANGSKTVLLFGGSHAASWQPALQRAAAAAGWRLVYTTKSSCRFSLEERDESKTDCKEYNANVLQFMRTLKPDLAVSTSTVTGDSGREVVPDGYRAAWEEISNLGVEFLMIRDIPRWRENPIDCVEQNPYSYNTRCFFRPSEVMAPSDPAQEIGDQYPEFTFVDYTRFICPDDKCGAKVPRGRGFPYRDKSHLTKSHSEGLSFLFEEELSNRKS